MKMTAIVTCFFFFVLFCVSLYIAGMIIVIILRL